MYNNIVSLCKSILEKQGSLVVAIDGMSAAGKTTLADRLSGELSGVVIHCDDFFLTPELRTKERLKEPGGNIDYCRMKTEVIEHLGQEFNYQKFDCKLMALTEEVTVAKSNVYIVEGAYAMHPYFGKYYNLSVFMQIDSRMQLERIRVRNGDTGMFESRWIPMENCYIDTFRVSQLADIIIDAIELI